MRKRLPGLPLRVINFDWHGMVKELREKGTVEGLWALLESIVSQVSLASLPLSRCSAIPPSASPVDFSLPRCAAVSSGSQCRGAYSVLGRTSKHR